MWLAWSIVGHLEKPASPLAAICASAEITDVVKIEFEGGDGRPDTVMLSGNEHDVTLTTGTIPDAVLGSWLLAHREDGRLWSCVYQPQPRAANGSIRQPLARNMKGGDHAT
jgi:hypothetical protein